MKKLFLPIIFAFLLNPAFAQQKFHNLTQAEKQILPQLFKEKLKPLALKRAQVEQQILNTYRICVFKAVTLEQLKTCDEQAKAQRQEIANSIVKEIENRKIELLQDLAKKENIE